MVNSKHLLAAALIIPAILLGVWKLAAGTGKVVPVVGAGKLAELSEESAPEGIRYRVDAQRNESVAQTRARVEAAITSWPDVIVYGLDEDAAQANPEEAQQTLDELAQQVENATGASVIVLDESTRALAESTCVEGRWRVCVDLTDEDDIAGAVAAGVRDGIAAHDALRATTQPSR